MENTKINKLLFFAFVFVFPFGQLLSLNIGNGYRVNPIDLIFLLSLVFQIKKSKTVLYISLPLFFGNIIWYLNNGFNFQSLFYVLRIFGFLSFTFLLKEMTKNKSFKENLPKVLFIEVFAVSILGLLQYFLLPDLRFLKILGWDDHYYRLVGTFFDPAYTAIILCLGFVLSLFYWIKQKNKKYFLFSVLLLISILLTYSRATFFAVFAVIVLISYLKKSFKILLFLIFFGLFIFVLPRYSSEGTELERTASISQRINNYQETFGIFTKNPVFGVGFNNICFARISYFSNTNLNSHSCSGADSSVLLVLADLGVVGLLFLLGFIKKILEKINLGVFNDQILLVSFIALLIHSQFTNSLFYPWVLGWFAILIANLRSEVVS